jgi:hypothetical protein
MKAALISIELRQYFWNFQKIFLTPDAACSGDSSKNTNSTNLNPSSLEIWASNSMDIGKKPRPKISYYYPFKQNSLAVLINLIPFHP